MSLISSPLLYPLSSSPPAILTKRKLRPYDAPPPSPKRRSINSNDNRLVGKERFQIYDEAYANTKLNNVVKDEVGFKQPGPFFEDDDDTEDDPAVLAMFPDILYSSSLPTPDLAAARSNKAESQGKTQRESISLRTTGGKSFILRRKPSQPVITYEQLISSRSMTAPGKATRSFYGIDMHDILDKAVEVQNRILSKSFSAEHETCPPSNPAPTPAKVNKGGGTMMWTEKYRAKKFTDLIGDERTHRDVLRWLKRWDPTVFPSSNKAKPNNRSTDTTEDDTMHRKILLLAGPPGLGKTTLAHVCARQAGYEVVEINASDERNRDVVKGRIRDSVGTENVKGVNVRSEGVIVRRAGRPVCVVVDEVDGVVSGSNNGGEGGFIKALIDLVSLDQKNSTPLGVSVSNGNKTRKAKKGDRFRLLRPMILICNDVYHPALRPLRSFAIAEIIHVRRPPLDKVVARLRSVFEKEGVACDGDGVRRLCEATWGISDRRQNRGNSKSPGEGDMRGILVVGEWAASKMRASATVPTAYPARITKKWVEQHIIGGLSHEGGPARGLGRSGAKEVVERVFLEGAGFPRPTAAALNGESSVNHMKNHHLGVSELAKRAAMDKLRDMVDTSGENDRIVTDCFAAYPSQPFQDDTFLSKPNAAYEWLDFHDRLSSRVFSGQEWEMSSYLSQTVLSFHYHFASPSKPSWSGDHNTWGDNNDEEEPVSFSGPRADFEASEAHKQTRTVLLGLQSSLPAPLFRAFRSPQDISVGLLPYLIRILVPNVRPATIGGSGEQKGVVSVKKEWERRTIERAAAAMSAIGVVFERGRIEGGQTRGSSHGYQMEP